MSNNATRTNERIIIDTSESNWARSIHLDKLCTRADVVENRKSDVGYKQNCRKLAKTPQYVLNGCSV